MIKAIIFDLDGLLIDSQHLQYQSASKAFLEKGNILTKEDWHHFIHGDMDYKKWIELNHILTTAEEVRARKKEIYDRLIKTELQLKAGADNLVHLLHGKFKLAVASHSRIESIEPCINKFDLRYKFEHVISDQAVGKRKPHPEVFLHVARIMNIEPEACLVFEDSLMGVKAAKSAGMKCIVCPDSFSNLDHKLFAGADKIVSSLNDVDLEMINEF
ncbi:MAG: HAD family phosphatase [Patescibacteria group bacterium]|nr:HAD family phosphatase [Patescibacteria group bacterium]